MKRPLVLIFIAALSAIAILFLDLMVGKSLHHSSSLNAPWPLVLEGIVLTAIVGYKNRYRGWLMGMLTMIAIYTLIFLILSFFILIDAITTWLMGDSVINLIRMNASVYGVLHLIQFVFIWLFLPSLAIGAVGGMIGEFIYKKSKIKK